jgi:16S rRNA processing protein RimM
LKAYAELVTIGRVVKPQGRKGEVVVAPLSDREDRFPTLRRAFVPAAGGGVRAVSVEACWSHKGRYVLKLAGVDSIEAAEAYRDVELRLDPDEFAPLPAGSYYHHELVGLTAEDAKSGRLGAVAAVMETGGTPVLVIRGERGETLVPLAEPFIEQVDVAAHRLIVKLPEQAGPRAAH